MRNLLFKLVLIGFISLLIYFIIIVNLYFIFQGTNLRNRSSYMSSDDDMVDITTSGTTGEGTLPTDLQYQPQGNADFILFFSSRGKKEEY